MDLFSTVPLFDMRAYIFALFTLISISNIGTIIDDVPEMVKNLFQYTAVKFVVLMMLLLQSGQGIWISIMMSAFFLGVMYFLKRHEDLQKFQQRFEPPSPPS